MPSRLTTVALLNAVAEETRAVADRDLLERFVTSHDESAFAALVRRYGPMVLGVCRRVLRCDADAEDAFQATFLVLTRKAAALKPRESLDGWLYQVAYRTAQKMRIAAARRRTHEERISAGSTADPLDQISVREAVEILDRELVRLPDRLRVPLVLCYLEGLTRDEAAGRLGWVPSLLKSRLEQGRERLARLAARGLTLAGALSATLVTYGSVLGAVPGPLLNTTVRAATTVAAGRAIASVATGRVAEVAQGVIRSMSTSKLKIAAALLLMVIGLGALGGLARENPTAIAAQMAVQPASEPKYSPTLPVERISARAEEPEPLTLKGHTCDVWSVCFSPDGKRIVTAGGVVTLPGRPTTPGEVKVWDAEKGTEILALKGQTARVCSVCFSPDGKRIAGASSDQTVRVWDAEKGQELLCIKEQTRSISSLCFSPDGKRIASISAHGTVKVWDAEKGQELLSPDEMVKPSGSVCFSPDGKRLAGCRVGVRDTVQLWNAEIKVWDAEKGKELLSLKLPVPGPVSVCFSPDGKRIASGGPDEVIRIWDADKGKELLALKGHPVRVSSVCFSPDGKRLVSGSYDKTVKVWNAETGEELVTLKGHTDILRTVCFSPDGKRIASASKDKTVKVWSLDKEK